MKKKLFVGLLASALVCLAFVFTNASSSSFSVSGTVEMSIDGDTPQPISGALIQITNSTGSKVIDELFTNASGEFHLSSISSDNRVRYSYSDDWGSATTQERQYFKGTDSEKITLHYSSRSSN